MAVEKHNHGGKVNPFGQFRDHGIRIREYILELSGGSIHFVLSWAKQRFLAFECASAAKELGEAKFMDCARRPISETEFEDEVNRLAAEELPDEAADLWCRVTATLRLEEERLDPFYGELDDYLEGDSSSPRDPKFVIGYGEMAALSVRKLARDMIAPIARRVILERLQGKITVEPAADSTESHELSAGPDWLSNARSDFRSTEIHIQELVDRWADESGGILTGPRLLDIIPLMRQAIADLAAAEFIQCACLRADDKTVEQLIVNQADRLVEKAVELLESVTANVTVEAPGIASEDFAKLARQRIAPIARKATIARSRDRIGPESGEYEILELLSSLMCRSREMDEIAVREDDGQGIEHRALAAAVTPGAADEKERLDAYILQLSNDGVEYPAMCKRLDDTGFQSPWPGLSWEQACRKHPGRVKTRLSRAKKRAVTRKSYPELPGNSVTV